MSNLVLVGFRCTGKSTVGRYLSKRLKMEFFDSDELIELRARQNIREIFKARGESWFRSQEADVLIELASRDNIVIATGGGCVLRYKTVQELKRRGRMVLLEADADTLYRRVKEDPRTDTTRPALTDKDLMEEITSQLEFRKPYYEKASELRVSTVGRPIDDIAEEIISRLGIKPVLDAPPPEGGPPPAAPGGGGKRPRRRT